MKKSSNIPPTKASPLKARLAFHFLKAMKKLNKNPSSPSMADKDKRYHAIRGAAYASMASAIGPRKAWSRAILRKHKLMMKSAERRSHVRKRMRAGNPRKEGLSLGQELKHLSEVVPGGKAMDSSKLLNESSHYIKCLTAQVEIMKKILHYAST